MLFILRRPGVEKPLVVKAAAKPLKTPVDSAKFDPLNPCLLPCSSSLFLLPLSMSQGKDGEAAPKKSLPAPDLPGFLALLKQQCGEDRSYEVSDGGRFVIVTKAVDVLHSDSTNPQRECGHACDVYDLTTFTGLSLFTSCYSRRFVMWYSRGGMSGSAKGSVSFDKDEATGSPVLVVAQYGDSERVPLPIEKKQ